MHVVNVSDVDRYLYCVTFSGKDMRGERSRVRREPALLEAGVFWLSNLPELVLCQLVRMLSYRLATGRK